MGAPSMNRRRIAAIARGYALALAVACVVLCPPPVRAQNANVTVNDQPTAEQRLGQVRELRDAGRLDQAAELIQELIEGSRFKLVGMGAGNYIDAERWCRQALLDDSGLRKAYTSRYSALAAHALEQAVASEQQVDALLDVYHRYTVTRSGLDAGVRLAGLMLESGEAVSAQTLVQELEAHPHRAQMRALLVRLRGAAAAYAHEPGRVQYAVKQLNEMGQAKQGQWFVER